MAVVEAFAILMLLRFAVLWVGICLGLIIRGPAAVNSVSTLLFPLTMVTSAFAPTESMPAWLGTIAEWNPLTASVYAARQLFGSIEPSSGSFVADHALALAIAWPLGLTAIFLPFAVVRFRNLAR